MYPTATRYPGPAKAKSFRQNPAPAGIGMDPCTSGRLAPPGSVCHRLGTDEAISGRISFNFDSSNITRVPFLNKERGARWGRSFPWGTTVGWSLAASKPMEGGQLG